MTTQQRWGWWLAGLACLLPGWLQAEGATTIDVLDVLAHRYATPQQVGAFLHQKFTFQRDQELFGVIEHWQTPAEFLANRKGDCEDYALLARALLLRNDIEAYIFSLFGDGGYAHTVCVFVDAQGRYNIIN